MRLYLATIERFADTDPALLDAQRVEEYAVAKSGRRRQEMLAGCGLLRYALSDCGYDVSEKALPVLYTEQGKPYLQDGPHFSLSHSGELIACVVSSENAGIDIERMSRFTGSKVAKKILSKTEYECYGKLDTDAKTRYLADRWTVKEAISKLLGKGIALPFSNLVAEEYRTTVWIVERNGEVYYIQTARMR